MNKWKRLALETILYQHMQKRGRSISLLNPIPSPYLRSHQISCLSWPQFINKLPNHMREKQSHGAAPSGLLCTFLSKYSKQILLVIVNQIELNVTSIESGTCPIRQFICIFWWKQYATTVQIMHKIKHCYRERKTLYIHWDKFQN